MRFPSCPFRHGLLTRRGSALACEDGGSVGGARKWWGGKEETCTDLRAPYPELCALHLDCLSIQGFRSTTFHERTLKRHAPQERAPYPSPSLIPCGAIQISPMNTDDAGRECGYNELVTLAQRTAPRCTASRPVRQRVSRPFCPSWLPWAARPYDLQ